MNQKRFQSLLKYYLSCIDAEEATQLKLRKNQENRTYIFLNTSEEEQLFSQGLPQLECSIPSPQQKGFIERKAANTETLIDLYYGFPVYIDEKDMLSPLFFMEVAASFSDAQTLRVIPKTDRFSVNRMHFVKNYGAEEIQGICEELEGEFGSFEARMKAAENYIPSLKDRTNWIGMPVLFRTNLNSSRSGIRYDLTCLLKDKDALTHDTALKFFVQGAQAAGEKKARVTTSSVLETNMLNDQQEEAVIQGLQESLSVVTGPPGTGKTQVVTTLIASAVYNNQSVLFASNNNMPVDGVYDRLGQSMDSPGNWIMRLGNQSKRIACHKSISALLERLEISDLSQADLAQKKEKFSGVDRDIAQTRAGLKKAQRLEEHIGKLLQKEYMITQKLPDHLVEQFTDIDPMALNTATIKKIKKHSSSGILLWFKRKLFGPDTFREKHNALLTKLMGDHESLTEYEGRLLVDEPWNEAISKAQETTKYIMLHHNWALCLSKRRHLEEKIMKYPSTADLFELKRKKSKISQFLFNQFWLNTIHGVSEEAMKAFNDYFKDIDDFDRGRHKRLEKSLLALKRFFPVWITTNQSASAIMPPQAALFDVVVIDEAGQCDIPSIIPLLYRARRAVIIGDPHQFQHITSLKEDIEHAIAGEAGVDDIYDEWSFTRRSAFDRALASASFASLLKQHYRCHPDIIEFSNRSFYEGQLVAQVPLSQFQNRLPIKESGLIWHNTAGQAVKAQKGAWNPAEVEKTADIFDRWAEQGLFSDSKITYGVVTPFRKQVQEMRKALSKHPWFESVQDRFTIGTAHSFQGSECDVLIYSPVVAEGMEKHLVKFAASQSDLINVTVTRAKNLLYIVGDLHACQSVSPDTPLHQLATYAESLRQQQHYSLNQAEQAMAVILEDLGLSYVTQYPLGQYRLDFIVNAPSGERYNLEVDGDIHLIADAVQHDDRRDAYVVNKGFKVLRFSARDVLHKPEIIKERLIRI